MASAPSTRSTGPRPAPYEQRDGESTPAFEAFKAYRDMGIDRSNAKVAAQLGKSKTLIDRWSSKNSWVLRAAAFDREQDRVWLQDVTRKRREVITRNLELAEAMKNLSAGSIIQLVQSQAKLKPGELARMLEVAARLEHMALQTVADLTPAAPASGVGGEAASRAHVGALSDEDRRARMEQLRRELDARLAGSRDDEDEDEAS